MKRLLLVLMMLACPFAVFGMTVGELVVTSGVINHAPIDKVEVYPAQTGKLYCFTRIEGAPEITSVTHVWLYRGKEMARISLPVRSASWRTFSSKNILPEWKGEWRVRVEDSAGTELSSVGFRVE